MQDCSLSDSHTMLCGREDWNGSYLKFWLGLIYDPLNFLSMSSSQNPLGTRLYLNKWGGQKVLRGEGAIGYLGKRESEEGNCRIRVGVRWFGERGLSSGQEIGKKCVCVGGEYKILYSNILLGGSRLDGRESCNWKEKAVITFSWTGECLALSFA